MKKLRLETIDFYKRILKHKINETEVSFSRKIFDSSDSSFYKKLTTLQKYNYIKIIKQNKGLITAKILNTANITINSRNQSIKPFVNLTKKQIIVFNSLKKELNLKNLNLTEFCKKYNLCSKTIKKDLESMQQRNAIKICKNDKGDYNITLSNVKTFFDPQESLKGKIYVIQNTISKNIKIGFTTKNINQRLKSLQTGNENKLEIISIIDGTFHLESQIHKKFKDLRLEGEWFKYDVKIIDFFNKHL